MALAYPPLYDVTYSYTGFQQSQQGISAFPGTQLDADLAGLQTTIDNVAAFVQGVMRSDGKLNNGVVTFDSLAPSLQALASVPVAPPIVVTGTAVGDIAGVKLDVSDSVVVTPSMVDGAGNFTPEGWYNLSGLTVNWTGADIKATGARTAILANAFLKTPSSPSNLANTYASAILTSNIYCDDNGTAGMPKGDAFALASVTYVKSTAPHWRAAIGAELDVVVEAGVALQSKVGVLVSNFPQDAVQGSAIDAAFLIEAVAGTPGWRDGFCADTGGGGSPLSSGGTLLSTRGAVTMANAIDVSSATVSGHLFKSSPLKITGQGVYTLNLAAPVVGDLPAMALYSSAVNQHIFTVMGRVSTQDLVFGVAGTADDFILGSNQGDSIIGYSGLLRVGLLHAKPHAIISSSGLDLLTGTAIPAGGAAATGIKLSSATNFGVFFGSGVPTLSAAKGSLYMRSDGSSASTRMYVNTDGGTTWTNVVTAA